MGLALMDASELLTEVQIRSGVTDVASRADHYIRSAERRLEKSLRVWAMLSTATLTADADGALVMPSDFLQLYTDSAVAVSGKSSLTPGSTHAVSYYRQIPSILLGPNWLSESEPEVYIQAVLFQVFAAVGKADEAVATNTLLEALLEGIREADMRARYLNRRVDLRGLMP